MKKLQMRSTAIFSFVTKSQSKGTGMSGMLLLSTGSAHSWKSQRYVEHSGMNECRNTIRACVDPRCGSQVFRMSGTLLLSAG